MKIEKLKLKFLQYSWLPTGTYSKNLANLSIFFSLKNPLHSSKSYFLDQIFEKILPIKETLSLSPPSKDELRTCFSKTLSGSPKS